MADWKCWSIILCSPESGQSESVAHVTCTDVVYFFKCGNIELAKLNFHRLRVAQHFMCSDHVDMICT